jgi:glucose-6-phosphate isomerase
MSGVDEAGTTSATAGVTATLWGADNAPAPLADTQAWRQFVVSAQHADLTAATLRIVKAPHVAVDLSAQAQSPALKAAGEALLAERNFDAARACLLNGGMANCTEARPAWHTALRSPDASLRVAAQVATERERVRTFVRRADAEGRYKHVVNIGIGGSDWGPRLVVSALGNAGTRREMRFVSNIDAHAIEAGLLGLDPLHTLIIVSSKSFNTIETLRNAERAIEWLRAGGVQDVNAHVVAVTSNVAGAAKLGITEDHVFKLWDWAGGRYSVWSSIGLPIALALGVETLDGLLEGAADMDAHFATAPISENAPVQLALTALVNRNVFGYPSLNIAAYDARLTNLAPYLQQLDMESLGKSVDVYGRPVSVPTGSLVWGVSGTDAQHTFFQWLHQGTDPTPVDFVVCREADHDFAEHHRLLLANCLAQREALLRGKSFDTLLPEVAKSEADPERAAWLAHHKVHPGGRPSTLLVLPRLTAHSLGALLALYEHKVFVQGIVWGINPFDQWGVEYGKVLATGIADELSGGDIQPHDVSTAHWVGEWK